MSKHTVWMSPTGGNPNQKPESDSPHKQQDQPAKDPKKQSQ